MVTGPAELAAIHAQMARGDIAGARRRIEAVIVSEPSNASALHLAGVVLRRAGALESAADAFSRARDLGLDSAEICNSLAVTLQELGRHTDALRAFDAAVAVDPAYEPAAVNRARLLGTMGRFGPAEAALRGWLAKKPGSILARNALAATLREAGQLRAAEREYAAVLAADPSNATAAINRGQILREIGANREALDHFRRTSPRHAGSPEFAESMAGALLANGDVAGARDALVRLTEAEPAYLRGHRALARITREYGLGNDPYRSFRALANRWPGEAVIWREWMALLLSFREFGLIGELVGEAGRHVGADPAITFAAAIASSELGKARAAEALFDRCEPALGGRTDLLAARARNALRLQEPERAEQLAGQVTRIEPLNQFGWGYLGLAWRLLEDDREFWLHDYERQTAQVPIPDLADFAVMEELCATLRGLHSARHHPPDQSLRGGTQTEGALFLLEDPAIAGLREAIASALRQFITALPEDPAHPFYGRRRSDVRFIGSWSVRLTGEGFHVAHLHEQGWISSALHLVLAPAGADGEAGALVLGEPPHELGLNLGPRRIIAPRAGSLVLFPSSMWHGTRSFAAGERLTVAFDAVPS